jgi:hypothetical protein
MACHIIIIKIESLLVHINHKSKWYFLIANFKSFMNFNINSKYGDQNLIAIKKLMLSRCGDQILINISRFEFFF